MWQTKRIAYLQQKKLPLSPDEIYKEQVEYLDGEVRFEYDTLQWEVENNNPRLNKDQERLVMTSYDEVEVNRGDRIRVGRKVYSVQKVTERVESEHERFSALNENTKRFTYKEIILQ